MCLCEYTLCIRHSYTRIPTDVHMRQSEQKQVCLLSIHSEFFTIFKISSKIAYSQVKFDEKLVGLIAELVWAISLSSLVANFWSKLFPEPPKITQWRIRIEQMFAHKYTFFSAFVPNILWCSLIYCLPGEYWWTVSRDDRMNSFTFVATSTLGECTCLLLFDQTHSLSVYTA